MGMLNVKNRQGSTFADTLQKLSADERTQAIAEMEKEIAQAEYSGAISRLQYLLALYSKHAVGAHINMTDEEFTEEMSKVFNRLKRLDPIASTLFQTILPDSMQEEDKYGAWLYIAAKLVKMHTGIMSEGARILHA